MGNVVGIKDAPAVVGDLPGTLQQYLRGLVTLFAGLIAGTYTLVVENAPYTFGALATAAMGNGAVAEVVPANAARVALWMTNVSDTAGYFSFGDGTGLTTAAYLFRLLPGQTISIEMPLSRQAITSAAIGQAAKNVCYQEAT